MRNPFKGYNMNKTARKIASVSELREFVMSSQALLQTHNTEQSVTGINYIMKTMAGEALQCPSILELFSANILAEYFYKLSITNRTLLSAEFYTTFQNLIVSKGKGQLLSSSCTKILYGYDRYKVVPSFELIAFLEQSINFEELEIQELARFLHFYGAMRIQEFPEYQTSMNLSEIAEHLVRLLCECSLIHPLSILGITKSLCLLHNYDSGIWESLFPHLYSVSESSHTLERRRLLSNHLQILQALDSASTFANEPRFREETEKLTQQLKIPMNFLTKGEKVTDLSRSVGKLLENSNLSYEEMHVVDGKYLVDFFIPMNRVIEVDGPMHYIRDIYGKSTLMLNGTTMHKSKILTAKGFEVLRLPYYSSLSFPDIINSLLSTYTCPGNSMKTGPLVLIYLYSSINIDRNCLS